MRHCGTAVKDVRDAICLSDACCCVLCERSDDDDCACTGGSSKVGSLAPGTVVKVLEKSVNSQGQARLRTAEGWVSLVARDGTVLLEDTKIFEPGVRRGVVPDDERSTSEREELAADMTAWLLDHPDGDLSGWVAESDWVRGLGSSPYAPCIASRRWSEVFEEQKRQMELLPVSGHDQVPERLDFDALRALGRQWAMDPVISDDQSTVREPLTTPAVMPGGTDGGHVGPATWSDVRDAAASAAKIIEACGEVASNSAAVSTVSSPQSGAAASPEDLEPAWRIIRPTTIGGSEKDNDKDDGGDDASEDRPRWQRGAGAAVHRAGLIFRRLVRFERQ